MDKNEILEELIKSIEELSPDYMDTTIAGLVTITVELYIIKQIQQIIQEQNNEDTLST